MWLRVKEIDVAVVYIVALWISCNVVVNRLQCSHVKIEEIAA